MAQRHQLHLAPAATTRAALGDAVEALDGELTRLVRVDNAIDTPNAPFVAGLEHPEGPEPLLDALEEIRAFVDLTRSVAVVGADHWFVPCAPTPVRYQYLMRRRNDFTHQRYLDRYGEVHSQFGIDTPGIEGYCQLHVDLDATTAFAARCAMPFLEVDSVSELYLASVATFFAALGDAPEVGAAATADEELFVDRPASQMYTSSVFR
jgi:hypothetical protein